MKKLIVGLVFVVSSISLLSSVSAEEHRYQSSNTDLLIIQRNKPMGFPRAYTVQSADGCVIHVIRDDWLGNESRQGTDNVFFWVRQISYRANKCPEFKKVEELIERIRTGSIEKSNEIHATADEGGSGTTVHGCGPNGCWQGPPPPTPPRPLNCHIVNNVMVCS